VTDQESKVPEKKIVCEKITDPIRGADRKLKNKYSREGKDEEIKDCR